jgi:hypothetical protein
MKTTKTFKLLSLSLFLMIFLINIVNAQTLVAGKVYDSEFSSTINGVTVSITCNSFNKYADTLGDGTYAIRFDESECTKDDSVSVIASKSGFQEKTGSGTVRKCEEAVCEEDYVVIINLGMGTNSPENNNGGSGRRYYYCGNNYCDTGETATTCPKDCKIANTTNATANITNATTQGTVALTILENQEQDTSETDNETQKSRGLITGAVIGAEGNSGLLVIIVFLAILLASLIAVRFMRNRKTITESI